MAGLDDFPMLARASVKGGKKSSRIEARVSDEVKLDLARRAHDLGMNESEFIERLVVVALYGIEHVLSVERARTEKVCGLSAMGPVVAPGFDHGRPL